VRLAVHADNAAEDVMGGAKPLLPAAVAENDNVIATWQLLPREEIAAKIWADAKYGKKVRADSKSANDLGWLTGLGQARIAESVGANLAISAHLASKIQIISGGDTTLRVLRCYAVESLELVALRIRQRLENNRINNAEHGGVRTYPQT
jgi:hypothetical protein